MDVVTATINAINSFDIAAVADLYTPNAVVTDDEAPYSWNGPTAGVQWVNAVEKVCKNNRLTKLKGVIEPINVYQQSADNCYIVVPVSFTGTLPGRQRFSVRGAFTFVLRQVNGKWLIKSQGWLQQKAINGR
jgi:ketosteroid isomerase-like protein